jgi:hypothetical protein
MGHKGGHGRTWGYTVRIPFIKYLPSQQFQQQRYILQINMPPVGCNEPFCPIICNQVKNSSTPMENLLIYFLVFSLLNFYFLTDVKQYEISCTQCKGHVFVCPVHNLTASSKITWFSQVWFLLWRNIWRGRFSSSC